MGSDARTTAEHEVAFGKRLLPLSTGGGKIVSTYFVNGLGQGETFRGPRRNASGLCNDLALPIWRMACNQYGVSQGTSGGGAGWVPNS